MHSKYKRARQGLVNVKFDVCHTNHITLSDENEVNCNWIRTHNFSAVLFDIIYSRWSYHKRVCFAEQTLDRHARYATSFEKRTWPSYLQCTLETTYRLKLASKCNFKPTHSQWFIRRFRSSEMITEWRNILRNILTRKSCESLNVTNKPRWTRGHNRQMHG